MEFYLKKSFKPQKENYSDDIEDNPSVIRRESTVRFVYLRIPLIVNADSGHRNVSTTLRHDI